MSTWKRTIAIDFDGCVHSYISGWTGETPTDPPVGGAREAIEELRREFNVIVFSCRALSQEGRAGILAWLALYSIEVDGVTGIKPHAELYVDDRAHRFDGNWEAVIMIANGDMKPWFKNAPASAPFEPLCGTCGVVARKVKHDGTYEVCGHVIP